MKINWLRFRFIYFGLSACLIIVSLFSLLKWGLVLSVDFKGGVVAEYKLEKSISNELVANKLSENNINVSLIQTIGDNSLLLKFPELNNDQKIDIKTVLEEISEGEITETKFENVGPSVGPELIKKTYYAIIIAASAILLWVAFQFKSLKFGVSAILAMFHDTFILIGTFSLLGHFYGTEIDFLFVTALLTTLSFSVHDTIVVYDRIREIRKIHGGEIYDIGNQALTETMRRSINNSLTIIFMLLSLVILGGSTVRWFATALLVGTVLGTYSSPFVAVPLLVTWDQITKRLK